MVWGFDNLDCINFFFVCYCFVVIVCSRCLFDYEKYG